MAEEQVRTDACPVCGHAPRGKLYRAREMFFGTRDTFDYLECDVCGTLRIREIPDLEGYYPKDYYSFRPAEAKPREGLKGRAALRAGDFIRSRVADYYCGLNNSAGARGRFLGRHFAAKMGRMAVGFPEYIKDARVNLGLERRSAILDVGSGAGPLLRTLRSFGFQDLTGVDPFVAGDIFVDEGLRVLKTELASLDREFDLIVASHSLEHMPDPRRALAEMRRLLKRGKYAIVRIPVVSYAWQEYGTSWVQMDAPRHLSLFTERGFKRLAGESGFLVERVVYDSTAFQFWGSEQYLRDIPLTDERSYFVNPDRSLFTPERINEFAARAAELNARGEGDQAVFYLHKV
ncbi:MAG TPA: class I SAM-dependent methyltransferase [Pyrinomonadaceae bacterium]|jgi:SAM-dependent methyltransferase